MIERLVCIRCLPLYPNQKVAEGYNTSFFFFQIFIVLVLNKGLMDNEKLVKKPCFSAILWGSNPDFAGAQTDQ